MSRLRLAAVLLCLLLPWAGLQAASRCAAEGLQPSPPAALAMAAAAVREHQAWGGQTMDAHGRLLAAGALEAEHGARAWSPWRRVLEYWQAVSPDGRQPSQVHFGAWRAAQRRLLHQALERAGAARLEGLGAGIDVGLTSSEQGALGAALDRAAVVDTPWSAAFISWLARQAGLDAAAFAFSEAHADYAAAAWQASRQEAAGATASHALRACALLHTPVRLGDIVCQARASAGAARDFESLAERLAERAAGGAAVLPMHCDVVVAVDAQGFDTIGGNVLDSVTRRRLEFAPGTQRLDLSYLPEGCASGPHCPDRHMSRQPWSLLLQWR